jgi:hypothetical protein
MYKYTLIILALTIFLFGCDSKKTAEEITDEINLTQVDSSDLVTTEVEDQDEFFYFRYKFDEGESINYRLTVISESQQNIVADTSITQSFNQTIKYAINFQVIDLDEDSIAELKCTISAVNLDASLNGEQISYKSGSTVDSLDVLKFAEYESLVNNQFRLRVNPFGEVADVYRVDKIFNKYLELRNMQDSLSAEQKDAVKNDMLNAVLKPLMGQIFRVMPAKQMGKDSSWTYTKAAIPMMVFQVEYNNLYKVDNLELLDGDKLAVINGTMITNISGDPNYSEQGISYVFEKPVSSAGGKVYFNLDKGLVQKSKTETKLETAYTMEMPSPQGLMKGSTKEVIINKNILELL